MKKLTVPHKQFDLKKFFQTITEYWNQHGTAPDVTPFPIVQGNIAYFGPSGIEPEEEGDETDAEDRPVPDDPAERLERGHALFVMFTRWLDFDSIDCADGTHVDVPDEDEEEQEDEEDEEATDRPKVGDRTRELLAKTYTDECSTYGFLVESAGATLVIQAALIRDVSGECEVEVVKDAGLFEEPMSRFVRSLVRKPRSKTRPGDSV